MPEKREAHVTGLVVMAEHGLRGALDQDSLSAESLIADRIDAWIAGADAIAAARLRRALPMLPAPQAAQKTTDDLATGPLPLFRLSGGENASTEPSGIDLSPPPAEGAEALAAMLLGLRIRATESTSRARLTSVLHNLGLPVRLANPAELASAAQFADQPWLKLGRSSPATETWVSETTTILVKPFAKGRRQPKAAVPLNPAKVGPFVARAFGGQTAEGAERLANFRLQPWLQAMRHPAATLEHPMFRQKEPPPSVVEAVSDWAVPEGEFDQYMFDSKSFSDELEALAKLPEMPGRSPRKAAVKPQEKERPKSPPNSGREAKPKPAHQSFRELIAFEGLGDLTDDRSRFEEDLLDPMLLQPTTASVKPAKQNPAPAFRKTKVRLASPGVPAGSLLSDLFEARPGTEHAPPPRMPRIVVLNDVQVKEQLQAMRRAARYGATEALSSLLRTSGSTLLADQTTQKAVRQLMKIGRSERAAPNEEALLWSSHQSGALGQTVAQTLAELGAPHLVANVARVFPYECISALRLPPPPDPPKPVTFSARLRAKRSLNWFRSGAPSLEPHLMTLTAAVDGRPVLNHGEADQALRPLPTDRCDPALIWASFVAHVITANDTAGRRSRRAVREALIVHLLPWLAVAETLTVTSHDGLLVADEVSWFSQALHFSPAPKSPSPFVLIVENQSGSMAEIADAIPANSAVYALQSRKWRRPHPDGLAPQEALARCALVLTDAPSNAVASALAGKLTLVLSDSAGARRLPKHDHLALVQRSKVKQRILEFLKMPADGKQPAIKTLKIEETEEKKAPPPRKSRRKSASGDITASRSATSDEFDSTSAAEVSDVGKARSTKTAPRRGGAARSTPRKKR